MIMNRINRKNKNKHGFTLIEALVAISILMIAIASPMAITQKGLSAAELSKDEMTASFLAEDGIEAVKNVRDDIALNASLGDGTDWLKGNPNNPSYSLMNCLCPGGEANCTNFPTSNYCNIDTKTLFVYANNVIPDPSRMEIVRDASGNFQYFGVGIPVGQTVQPSIFSRYINVVPAPSSSNQNQNEAEVNVVVKWSEASGQQSVTLSDFIYNYSANVAQK